MAIAADISVAVNGDIRYTGTTANYTVLELHRFLQDLADNAQAVTTSGDYMDISFPTPSERVYDTIIRLNSPYNINDALAEHLYGGSIEQAGGDTLYAGLKVVGSVNTAATQIQVIQDHALYDGDSPFWGTQAAPYNGGGSVHFRILVKCRESGYDIDGKRARIRCGHWGDSYASFDVDLGVGESVGAVSSVPDAQNDTAQGTVQGWAGGDIPTNVEGYQQIDINDGNGNQPYYSKWTYNTNAAAMKALWEWAKDITNVGTVSSLYGIDGDLFRGITHEIAWDAQATNMQEDEYVVWGTHVWYDGLAGGEFTRGYYVVFGTSGAAGKVLFHDATNDEILIAVEDTGVTIVDDETITEYNPATGVASGITAVVDTGTGGGSAVANNDKEGGEGWVLALDDNGATGSIWVQITHGTGPVDNLPLTGVTTSSTIGTTAAPTSGNTAGDSVGKTIPAVFLGSYTGSLIGAFGVGIDASDLASGDTVEDLDGDTNSAPNNVTYTVSGLVASEDYLLVGKKAAGDDFKWTEMALATALVTTGRTAVVIGHANGDVLTIPADAAATGTLRVTLDDGRRRKIAYTAHDSNVTFTIGSSDWSDPDDAAVGNGVMLAFIDLLATGTSEQFTVKYDANRTLWQRRRDGGSAGDGIPTKTWEQQGNLTNTGGSAIASRISDA